MIELLKNMLGVPTPTFQETACCTFIEIWLKAFAQPDELWKHKDSLVASWNLEHTDKPHLCFVGHTDVVGLHVEPRIEGDRLYGTGASDMKGGLAAFMAFISDHLQTLHSHFRVSLIAYSREEGTPVTDNGLYDLIQFKPEFFKTIDCAIVGEPTNGAIQLGCLGSLHAKVTIEGKAAHSARPWDGDNALYNALPFLQAVSLVKPIPHPVGGVTYTDVMQITEGSCQPGRTSIPGWWTCNVNFRFAPVYTPLEAELKTREILMQCGAMASQIQIVDVASAGGIIETPFFKKIVGQLGAAVEAKQAWTDVAQLTALGIPAFNFGPGLTSQAHQPGEYILISGLVQYKERLEQLLIDRS